MQVMADMLPKIVEAAKKVDQVNIKFCPRPARMAKELRKHLPNHDIIPNKERQTVTIKRRIVFAPGSCSTGPACTGRPA